MSILGIICCFSTVLGPFIAFQPQFLRKSFLFELARIELLTLSFAEGLEEYVRHVLLKFYLKTAPKTARVLLAACSQEKFLTDCRSSVTKVLLFSYCDIY